MTVITILLATFAAGIGSVWVAAALMGLGMRTTASRSGAQNLLSLAAGALLATAFMHLLPEAFDSAAGAKPLFATLLVSVVFFFLLDKAELWHHGHEHHHGHAHHGLATPGPQDAHAHAPHGEHAHLHEQARHGEPTRAGLAPAGGSGGWAVLAGDSVHCFGDGVLIASAFVADMRLGFVAAVAVLAHEVPHHIGDLAVLGRSSGSRRAAIAKVSLAGAVTPLGGLVGWALVDRLLVLLPFFLVVAGSSFIYVALADLIPQLQKRLGARETLGQVLWLGLGILLVAAVGQLFH